MAKLPEYLEVVGWDWDESQPVILVKFRFLHPMTWWIYAKACGFRPVAWCGLLGFIVGRIIALLRGKYNG
jgi:hypothetical protein